MVLLYISNAMFNKHLHCEIALTDREPVGTFLKLIDRHSNTLINDR